VQLTAESLARPLAGLMAYRRLVHAVREAEIPQSKPAKSRQKVRAKRIHGAIAFAGVRGTHTFAWKE